MQGDTKKWLKILFLIAMAAPILTAIFATGGPFEAFNSLAGGDNLDIVTGETEPNALQGNNYLPILAAAVTLIPIGLLGVFFFKFISGNAGDAKRRRRKQGM